VNTNPHRNRNLVRFLVACGLVCWFLLAQGCVGPDIKNDTCIAKVSNTSRHNITVVLEDGSAVNIPPGQVYQCGD